MLSVSGYDIDGVLYAGRDVITHRGRSLADGRSVLLKCPLSEHPSRHVLARLRRELTILTTLDGDRINRAVELVPCSRGLALVVEDHGADTLRQHFERGPLTPTKFTELAVGIVDAVAALHRHGLAHRNLSPEAIMVTEDGLVTLTDLNEAAPFTSGGAAGSDPERSFEYVAPEQTGRLNRAVDQRSDLYVLGVIFFQLLTGRLPFVQKNRLELAHAHITDQPPRPSSLTETIPPCLDAIVLKLLAKMADERYQSAAGLRHDLDRCREFIDGDQTSATFELGTVDPAPQLSFADRLYGSEGLVHEFLAAFERASKGSRELVLIAGAPGSGKSHHLNDIRHNHLPKRGQVLAGRCQPHSLVPYGPLLTAVRGRMQAILGAEEAELSIWRMQIEAAIGDGAALLGGFIPEIGQLLGEVASTASTPATEDEDRQRFQSLFDALLRAIATAQPPFVIVLDDLHQIDPSSAGALARIFEDPRGHAILVTATYCTNSPDSAHLVRELASAVAEHGATVTEQTLAPLSGGDTVALLRDCLTPSESSLRTLADHVFGGTGGNPHLTRLLLETLHRRGSIRYETAKHRWSWSLGDEHPDYDLLALLGAQLAEAPAPTKEALAAAACIDLQFDLSLLRDLLGANAGPLALALKPALERGLIRSIGEPDSSTITYTFTHPSLLEPALASLDVVQRQDHQRRLGRILLDRGAANDERIFDAAAHLSLGLSDSAGWADRSECARLCHEAGMRAMVSGGYATAEAYFERGIALMPAVAWQDEHRLMLGLFTGLADARLLLGDPAGAGTLFDRALSEMRSSLGRAELLAFKISREIGLRRFSDALTTGRAGLKLLGIKLPAASSRTSLALELTRLRWQLRKRSIRCVLDAPESLDRRTYVIHNLLVYMAPAALFTDFKLAALIFLRLTNLTLETGRTEFSAFGVAGYGLFLSTMQGDYSGAAEASEVADELLTLLPSPTTEPRVDLITGLFVQPWSGAVQDAKGRLERGHDGALRRGDLAYACFAGSQVAPMSFFVGDNLSRVEDQAATYVAFLRHSGASEGHHFVAALERLCHHLRALDDEPLDTSVARPPQDRQSGAGPSMGGLYVPLYCGICLYHAGDHSEAQIHFDAAAQDPTPLVELVTRIDLDLFSALNLAELAMQASPGERRRIMGRIAEHHERLLGFAALSRPSFGARAEIISGVRAWMEGRTHEALPHLNAAISLASEAGDSHREALAAELAARVAIATETTFLLDHYLDLAFDAYQRYGAIAKLSTLRASYGERRPANEQRSRVPTETSTLVPLDGGTGKSLDVGTVIKATQALSGEIVLDRLLDTLIQVVMENAGARRCFLVLVHEGRLLIEAEGSVDSSEIEVLRSTPIEKHDDLPHSILKYVIRSGSSVVLEDAGQRGAFTKDHYVRREALKSVLCMPIIHHNKVMGALYLENNLATDVFTGDRLELLNQLAAQLAISVDNARLYESLDQARENAVNADQAKTRFLMNMSHELRTPLNAIIGYTELIEEDLMDGVSDGFVDDIGSIQTAALRLERTLESALELSRIEAGTFTIELEDVDVNELIRDILRELAPVVSERNNQLNLEIDEVGLVISDRLRLRYCLRSVLDNAIRFTEGGSVSLKVQVHGEGYLSRLGIIVGDSGIGIPPEHMQRVFAAFTQADDSTTRSYEGSGVSLAVTRHICDALGGSITAESTVGVGSVFTIDLPIRRPSARTQAS